MTTLDGKVALVTGAGRGLGAAIAAGLAARGARVVVVDLDETAAKGTAEQIGRAATYRRLDVRDAADWRATVTATLEEAGSLDVLVNNAGVYRKAPIEDWSDEDIALVLDVNLLGTILGVREASRSMADGGAIVNISSTAGLSGHRHALPYSATKFAVRGVTRSAALELADRGIRVNAVCPGAIATSMLDPSLTDWSHLPLGRPADPSEVADLVAFLASSAAAYCTGGEYTVDGGISA